MKPRLRTTFLGGGLVLVLLMAIIAPTALPQSSLGSVRGTVHDQSDAVVPNADVTLTNIATNVVSKGKSNENGIYVFPAIAPGQYHIKVEAAGLQPYQATLTESRYNSPPPPMPYCEWELKRRRSS